MRTLLLLLLPLLCAGCASGGASADLVGARFALVDLKLNVEHLESLGVLPTFDSPIPGSGAVPPYAVGTLAINEQRQVVCTVTAHDLTTGTNGAISRFDYNLIRFTGLLDNELSMADAVGVDPRSVRAGVATRLAFRELDDQRLEVKTFTGTTELPYVYIFRRNERARPISVPYYEP